MASRGLRTILALCALVGACALSHAQAQRPPGATAGSVLPPIPGGVPQTPGSAAPPGNTTQPSTGQAAPADNSVRFIENCQQALERGEVPPGCQGPLYPSEIARLKDEALRSRDPALLTLLGDAYQGNRSAISDVGQAYRWYLLAAVRGDPRAMQRLSELYRGGSGAPQDRVRALGYARLAQRLAVPGSKTAADAAQASASLGGTMATEELALADRFAGDLESQLRQQGAVPLAGEQAAVPTGAGPRAEGGSPAGQGGITLRERATQPGPGPAIPGMSSMLPPAAR